MSAQPSLRLLVDSVGLKLKRVLASIYEPGDGTPPDELTPNEYWLDFVGGRPLRLAGASSGWMQVDQKSPESIDMQESGRIVVRDASKSPPFAQLIGREMTGVRVLLDEFNVQFGVRLVFGGASLLLYNWCDELYASQMPPDYPEWTHVRDVPLATLS